MQQIPRSYPQSNTTQGMASRLNMNNFMRTSRVPIRRAQPFVETPPLDESPPPTYIAASLDPLAQPTTEYTTRLTLLDSTINGASSLDESSKFDYSDDDGVYIISNIHGGGTKKYKDDIQSMYPDKKIYMIVDRNGLYSVKWSVNSIMFVQQLLFSDIFPSDISRIKSLTGCNVVITIHDFCWLNSTYDNTQSNHEYHHNYLADIRKIDETIVQLFQDADIIITPSMFVHKVYSNIFGSCRFIHVPHIDYNVDYTCKRVPPVRNKTINIGVFHELNMYKGEEIILYMKDNLAKYLDYDLHYYIVGDNIHPYSESDIYERLREHNIHCLLMLNKWGETYCYSLTKYINSGLPVLYNRIGALTERIGLNTEHYFVAVDAEREYHKMAANIKSMVQPMLDYVIRNNGRLYRHNINTTLTSNAFYDIMFGTTSTIDFSRVHDKVLPFAIYFPQFHQIPENDVNYYPGMTDLTNLQAYLEVKPPSEEILTPSLSFFNIDKITDYNVTSAALQQKQVDLAHSCGLKGFAIYYYWFSSNSITNNHLVMQKGYDNFFNGSVVLPKDFKVYFIWANEDWSGNPAFNSSEIIKNAYTRDSFERNIDTLMQYFKHDNYYKIDNKPVFYIHHPWLISHNSMALLTHLLNERCVREGFDGVNITINNIINNRSEEYTHHGLIRRYHHNPDYKKIPFTIDYRDHINENIKFSAKERQMPMSMYFSFNNKPRLYIPNRHHQCTIIQNTTYVNQYHNLQVLLNTYNIPRSEPDRILLLNSWNEWGENMSIEPSNEKGMSYLNMIKMGLLQFMNL